MGLNILICMNQKSYALGACKTEICQMEEIVGKNRN